MELSNCSNYSGSNHRIDHLTSSWTDARASELGWAGGTNIFQAFGKVKQTLVHSQGQKKTTLYHTEKEEIHAPNGALETKETAAARMFFEFFSC